MTEALVKERIAGLEREVRARVYGVEREVAVERGITRDLVEALHLRIDRFEDRVLEELRGIKTLLTTNGDSHA